MNWTRCYWVKMLYWLAHKGFWLYNRNLYSWGPFTSNGTHIRKHEATACSYKYSAWKQSGDFSYETAFRITSWVHENSLFPLSMGDWSEAKSVRACPHWSHFIIGDKIYYINRCSSRKLLHSLLNSKFGLLKYFKRALRQDVLWLKYLSCNLSTEEKRKRTTSQIFWRIYWTARWRLMRRITSTYRDGKKPRHLLLNTGERRGKVEGKIKMEHMERSQGRKVFVLNQNDIP